MQTDPRAWAITAAFVTTAIVVDHWIALVVLWLYISYAIDAWPRRKK